MKAIRFLCALYIIALSVYPCSDANTCADEKENGIAFVDYEGSGHSDGEQDACTPFCVCSCCAAHIQLNYSAAASLTMPVHNTKLNTPYFEKPLLHNAKAIWQPPKIS